MKFTDEGGRLIDLYEQSTQWEDDVAIGEYFEQMTPEQAIEPASRRCGRSGAVHTVANFNFHPIHIRAQYLDTGKWIAAVASFCLDHQIPMIGGDDWVRFHDARRLVEMSEYRADAVSREGRFRLWAQRAVQGLTLTLPAAWTGSPFQEATADGAPLASRVCRVHRFERTFIVLSLAKARAA